MKIPHIILTVKNFEQSKKFYTSLFINTLGAELKIDAEDFFYFRINSDDLSIGFSQQEEKYSDQEFDRYRIGLHHFAIALEDNKQVDIAYQKVIELGCEILDKPQIWSDYGDNYYAFYYLDPNGFKMEFVAFE